MNAFSNFTIADAALSVGKPVFPCNDEKRPIVSGGFHSAASDANNIRAMFARHGATMVGVPTGSATGLIVIDVDVKDEARNGRVWLMAHEKAMPRTRIHRTASGGLHYLFKEPPGVEIRNSNDDIAIGIDVRGEGGYVIWPGSPGYSVLDDADPADMPAWLVVECLNANSKTSIATPSNPPPAIRAPAAPVDGGGTPYGLAALQDECDAIRRAPFGRQESTLNEACLKIGALIKGGELIEGNAIAELRAAGCAMPSQAKRDPWRPADIDAKVRRGVADGMRQGRSAPERVEVDAPNPAQPMLDKIAEDWARKIAHRERTKTMPVGSLESGGILQMFVDHCNRTAISPQPFLALAAGICAIGALAGQRYRTTTDLRTNIYAIGIADSGGGKDHARKQIKNIFLLAGLKDYLGGEDIASGAAINAALVRHPKQLFQIDEFGDWLRDILGKNASPHKKQIAQRLKTAYSSANSWMPGTEYADQSKDKGRPRIDIKEPCVCLYGTTTPNQFWSAIAGASLEDGLMARFILFVTPCNFPDEQRPRVIDPPPELIEAFQSVAAGVSPEIGGNLSSASAYTVPETHDAEMAIAALRREQLASQRKAEGTYVTAIAGRLAENAMKLALIRAVSRNPANPVIEASDVAWGRALSAHCVDTLLRDASRHVSENEFEAKLNKAVDIIRRHGPITKRDMFRRGFKLAEREAAEVFRTLIENGVIVELGAKAGASAGGRPTVRYVVTEYQTSILAKVDDDETGFGTELSD